MPTLFQITCAVGFLGSGMFFLRDQQTKRQRQSESEYTPIPGSYDEKISTNIREAAPKSFLENLDNLSKEEPGGIAGLKVGEEQLSVPVALAKHILYRHKKEPRDYTYAPGDNTDFEEHQKTMLNLCTMVICLSSYYGFNDFTARLPDGNPSALDILFSINHPDVLSSLKVILAQFKRQGAYISLSEHMSKDILLTAIFANIALFKLLLAPKYGNININKRDENGNTALHRLILSKKQDAIMHLVDFIQNGANLDILNDAGLSVRDLAITAGIPEEDYSAKVNLGLHYKMYPLVAKHIANMSREQYSAFICRATDLWQKNNRQYTETDRNNLIKQALKKVWNGDYAMDKAWFKRQDNMHSLILTTKLNIEEFEVFLSSTTRSWYKCIIAEFIEQATTPKEQIVSLCCGAALYWNQFNPHKPLRDYSFETELYGYDETTPTYFPPMKLPDEQFAKLVCKDVHILKTIALIYQVWLESQCTKVEIEEANIEQIKRFLAEVRWTMNVKVAIKPRLRNG